MQPARLDLPIIQGATLRQVLRIMQPVLEYRAITAIAPTAPVQLTVDHGLPSDWPVWVRGVTRMPALNAEPIRQRPHMATVLNASTLEINPLSATGLSPAGGELVYNLPVDLTGATAVLQVLDDAGGELLSITPTVNAGGWIDVELSDEETAALVWRAGNWLLDISFSNGDVFRAFTGSAKVWPAGTSPVAAGMCAGGWVVTAGAQGVPGGQGPIGPAFQVDATGPTAERSLYDAEPEGFSFLDTTTGELFFREGAGWSAGVQFQGPPGISAYQVALDNGFVGTEAEWLEFLQGVEGDAGVGIANLAINGAGHLVVTYTNSVITDLGLVVGADGADGSNGSDGAAGADGADGANGSDGRGIASVAINGSGHLIITYDDTTTEDAGLIPGGGGSAAWGAIGGTLADQADLGAALGGKVDKVAGKGLSENDYSTAEKTKLGTVASNATANPDTDSLDEGDTNKWFTVARVLAAVLTGLSVATGGSVVETDTVLQAIGKLQKQITDLATAVSGKMANPMTAAGDVIVGGASGAPTRQAKGTDGQVFKMVAGSPAWGAESGANWGGIVGLLASQTDLQSALDAKAGQNLLINGDFGTNQRAFAGGALSAGSYGHDRWGAYNGGANYTASSGVVTIVSGAICQNIETPGLAGVTVTVSIDSPTAAVTVHVGSGANYATGTIASGAGRRSLTLTVPAAVTGDVKLRLSGAASFSRVKLERGATATAWQDTALGLSRILCCRYFYAFLNTSGVVFAAKVVQTAGVAGICNFDFPARMRALPAVTASGIRFVTTGGTATTTDAAILTGQYAPGTLSAKVNFDSFVTLPNPSNLVLNAASSHVSFDAELACTD